EMPPSPYQLVFTAEGYPQDVDAELLAAHAVVSGTETDTFSGIDVWAAMMRSETSHLRIGVAPRSLPDFIQDNADALGESYVVDLSSGVVHVMPVPLAQVPGLLQAALDRAGYAVVVGETRDTGIDPWGYVPDTLPLMRALKARWDPKGCLNPGVFLV
ncbi:MAG: hypothetical protein MUO76_21205, partial [Anaerolineaceae bacterium]|nr:hypothetical protein [Anaerolineaceae bacterium]